MESYNLWNVWVHLTNGLDREFVVNATPSQIEELRTYLGNREHVREFDIAGEYGELDVNGFMEDLGQWIADEVE